MSPIFTTSGTYIGLSCEITLFTVFFTGGTAQLILISRIILVWLDTAKLVVKGIY